MKNGFDELLEMLIVFFLWIATYLALLAHAVLLGFAWLLCGLGNAIAWANDFRKPVAPQPPMSDKQ